MKLTVREVRLVPVVLFATGGLLALKLLGLASGGYVLGSPRVAQAEGTGRLPPALMQPDMAPAKPAADASAGGRKQSWAQEVLGYPDPGTTASVSAPKPPDPKPADAKPAADKAPAKDAPPPPKGAAEGPASPPSAPRPTGAQPIDPSRTSVSGAERAILERLQERRNALDIRAREIEVRESLLKAAEKRLEAKLKDLKDAESRITVASQRRDEAEATRFKGLVTMYESMKAKDAAKIFDRLEMRILAEVATQMNPRRMSDILAQMSTEAAEKLTVELANRAGGNDKTPGGDLPKIEGRPSGT